MNDADQAALLWFACSEEYLDDAFRLVDARLREEASTCSRPAALLISYFIETLFKAVLVHESRYPGFSCHIHSGLQLFAKVGMTQLNKSECDIVEFLGDVATWGKYPSPMDDHFALRAPDFMADFGAG